MKFTQAEINWIANEYMLGRSVDEIKTDTGISHSQIRRALAEAKLIKLDWYKTKEEIAMLNYLYSKDITTLNQLMECL